MTTLIRAELLKLRTTRTVWGLLAGTVGLSALSLLAIIGASSLAGDQAGAVLDLRSTEGIRTVVGAASAGTILVMVLGILTLAGEYRHATITHTFLVTPTRGRVVAAKLAALALAGLLFGVVAAAVTLGIAVPWLAARDVPFSVTDREVGLVLLGCLASSMLWGALGVSVGALLRNQVAAVLVALAWRLVVEGIVIAWKPGIGKWLPGGAEGALERQTFQFEEALPMWGGGLLLAAYAVALALAGSRLVVARDVT